MATTVEKGRVGEDAAVRTLVARGYVVLERNARTKRGELDVVALDGDVLVFVEVRSRKDDAFGGAAATVDGRKQARVVRAAWSWLVRVPQPWPRCRFDVVAIDGDVIVVHKAAFEARP